MKRRVTEAKLLEIEALKKLSVERLLSYRDMLLSAPEGRADDLRPKDPNFLHKTDYVWQVAYYNVMTELEIRENRHGR